MRLVGGSIREAFLFLKKRRKISKQNSRFGLDKDDEYVTIRETLNNHYGVLIMQGTFVHLTPVSSNSKTGPIPVSTTERKSCPRSCGFLRDDNGSNGCYADGGPLGIHWSKVGEGGRGDNFLAFCDRVRRFPKSQVWRHNQAGDLPKGENSDDSVDRLDSEKCLELADAAKHTNGWTYTHYDPTDSQNQEVIRSMNEAGGLVVNLSAESLSQADRYHDVGCGPVCVTLPADASTKGLKTPGGIPVVLCPIQHAEEKRYRDANGIPESGPVNRDSKEFKSFLKIDAGDNISCAACRICRTGGRNSIVAFKAHGVSMRKISEKLRKKEQDGF